MYNEEQTDTQKKAIALICAERKSQDDKWGQQLHSPEIWLAILAEEVGEMSQQILADAFGKEKHGNGTSSYICELIQVAAVAMAMLESALIACECHQGVVKRLDAAKDALRRESLDSSSEVPEEDIVTSSSYLGKLEEEIDQRTAELKVLLDKYKESVRLSAKEKLLPADHCLNMLLDTDTTVVRTLFSSRPDNHAARIANGLTNAYHTSWGD